jgi:hypothetical protein
MPRVSSFLILLLICAPTAFAAPADDVFSRKDFFPTAVWLQDPKNATKFKELGVNLYVGLWRGPTEVQLAALDAAGMHVICGQKQAAMDSPHSHVIVGWMHGDEPDNAQPRAGGGYGPPILPQKIVDDYQRMKKQDPTRPIMLNLGQAVAWDDYIGRGVRRNHPEDYPPYVRGCDIASFDIYPVTHDSPRIAGNLWYVGHGVERLIDWTGGQKPVWCCIETVGNGKTAPTPAQIRSEVWIGITHGARGIIYFCHQFKPRFIEAGPLAYPQVAEGMRKINEELRDLAPVLNSPTLRDAVEVRSSDPQVPVSSACKRYDGQIYIFAVSLRNQPCNVTFTFPGSKGPVDAQILGERRGVHSSGGGFTDHFGEYEVRMYKTTAGR